jgi:hypothetical protein
MTSNWNSWDYNCPKCSFGCSSEKLLKQHIENKHPEPKIIQQEEKNEPTKENPRVVNPYKNINFWK